MGPSISFHYSGAFTAICNCSSQLTVSWSTSLLTTIGKSSVHCSDTRLPYATLSAPSHVLTCRRTPSSILANLQQEGLGQCRNDPVHSMRDEKGQKQDHRYLEWGLKIAAIKSRWSWIKRKWYGDSAGNTTEENSSISSLIWMPQLPSVTAKFAPTKSSSS